MVWKPDKTFNDTMALSDEQKIKFADIVAKKICELDGIRTAYDFGCGSGIYTEALIKTGVETLGLDVNDTLAIEQYHTARRNMIFVDLSLRGVKEDFNLSRRELVVSIEVAEHIEKSNVDIFFGNIIDLADRWIFLTASPEVGQYHVNPQPRDYWIEKVEQFKKHEYEKTLSENFMKYFKMTIPLKEGLVWFKRDLMIFRRIRR